MSILDALKQRQLQQLSRSIASSEHKEREVHNHASHVKAVLTGKAPSQDVPLEVRQLKDLYYEMYQDYTGKNHTKAPLEMSNRSIALWMRVEQARQQASCDAKKYMRAQFYWFDKHFGTYPRIEQLATEAAIERAVEFTGNAAKRVVGTKAADIPLPELFKRSEQLVQEIMQAQNCTRTEFYERFVKTGLFTLPQAFLEADPAWRELK